MSNTVFNAVFLTLIDACLEGDWSKVKEFIQQLALVDQGADLQRAMDSAMYHASVSGHLQIVQYLVSRGANIHVENERALRWAANRGRLPVVQYLVSLGADVSVGLSVAKENSPVARWLVGLQSSQEEQVILSRELSGHTRGVSFRLRL